MFGLPSSHFDLALLWQPAGGALRLQEPKHKEEQKYKDMRFPSWSWCGWKSIEIEYTSDMINGCVTNVRSWLSGHTRIDWHICNGHGTLRRVWDKSWASEDKSSNSIWRGYNTCETLDSGHNNQGQEVKYSSYGVPLQRAGRWEERRAEIYVPGERRSKSGDDTSPSVETERGLSLPRGV